MSCVQDFGALALLGPPVWNTLPPEICPTGTLSTLKELFYFCSIACMCVLIATMAILWLFQRAFVFLSLCNFIAGLGRFYLMRKGFMNALQLLTVFPTCVLLQKHSYL